MGLDVSVSDLHARVGPDPIIINIQKASSILPATGRRRYLGDYPSGSTA